MTKPDNKKMNKDEFLYIMYRDYGIVPEITERYLPEIEDYSEIDRDELETKIVLSR